MRIVGVGKGQPFGGLGFSQVSVLLEADDCLNIHDTPLTVLTPPTEDSAIIPIVVITELRPGATTYALDDPEGDPIDVALGYGEQVGFNRVVTDIFDGALYDDGITDTFVTTTITSSFNPEIGLPITLNLAQVVGDGNVIAEGDGTALVTVYYFIHNTGETD